MSTRSLIGIKNNLGITFVYCHHDGYLEGVGTTLVESYTTEDKINALLEHGDMSSLDDTIEKCDFYHEDGSEACTIPDCEGIRDKYYESGQNSWADYIYLFEDGKWYYTLIRADYKNDRLVYLPAQWELLTEGIEKLNLIKKLKNIGNKND